jgi:hypothetical protein
MKNLFFVFFFLLAVSASAQLQFNTPFSTVAELSRNEAFRSRVGVAMYVRAGQALVDTVRQGTPEKYYEKLFASLIVTEGDNKYFVSLFTNAALTQGAQLATPDVALYAYVNALWPEIVKAWMYRNGYVTMQSPD